MKRFILLMFLIFIIQAQGLCSSYGLYSPENYNYNKFGSSDEKILFIMDFSNSMTEYLDGKSKLDLMLETMAQILPNIGRNVSIGLRVYGHKMGFSAFDACRASTLMVPIGPANSYNVHSSLLKAKPRGMTPITYSLKQAVKYDFLGVSGRKRIILLTDGGENCDESPCTYVMELVKIRRDIAIDVIAFNVKDRDDLEQLECTALVTSGKFYNADTAAQLIDSMTRSVSGQKEVEAKIITNK